MSKLLDWQVPSVNASGSALTYTTPTGAIIQTEYICYNGTYSLSNALYPETTNDKIFLSNQDAIDSKFITITLPGNYFVIQIEIQPNTNFPSSRYTKGNIQIYQNDSWITIGTFNNLNAISTTIINKKINKFRLQPLQSGDFGVCIPYIGVLISPSKCLIKQGDNYYSIKDNMLTELGTPADNTQKKQWFNDCGIDDLKGVLLTPDENRNKLIDDLDDKFEVRMMVPKD